MLRDATVDYSMIESSFVLYVVEFQKNEGDETLIEFLARNLCPASLFCSQKDKPTRNFASGSTTKSAIRTKYYEVEAVL